jgi:hypothetical protein
MLYKVKHSYYVCDVTSYNLVPTFYSIVLPPPSSSAEFKSVNGCVHTYLAGAAKTSG